MLNRLIDDPARPYIIILGGGKVPDKITLLEQMLDRVDTIMLCPAIVFTFLLAQGHNVGSSLVDPESIDRCREFINRAHDNNVTLLFPHDYQVAHTTINGPLRNIDAREFTEHDSGISIGPKTIDAWKNYIEQAGSIFYNSGMGFLSRPETLHGAHDLLAVISESSAYTVIGGGESAAIAERFHLNHRFDFVSTGGGATLAYLTGKALPGLEAIIR
jgi:phosphoglycerate kinase